MTFIPEAVVRACVCLCVCVFVHVRMDVFVVLRTESKSLSFPGWARICDPSAQVPGMLGFQALHAHQPSKGL